MTTLRQVEKIMLLTRSHMGDLILMTPAIRAVRETFPKATISIIVRSGFEDLFMRNKDVDAVLTFDFQLLRRLKGWKRLREELRIVRKVRREKPDLAICFYPEDRTALWAFLSRAQHRVGPRIQPLNFLLNLKVDASPKTSGTLEYFLEIVRAVGCVVKSRDVRYDVSNDGVAWAESFLESHNLQERESLIGIHPGASAKDKTWPPENFAAIIDELNRDSKVGVVLFQGPSDVENVRRIVSRTARTVAVADTNMSVDRLASLMKRCHLCVTNDSGPRHLAASVGTATLGLFRRTYAPVWKIYGEDSLHAIIESSKACPHCPQEKCMDKIPPGEIYGSYCLREVTTNDVITKVREMLNGRLNRRIMH